MAAIEPFLFGKLPSHGDFVWRGLSPEARQSWDSWASLEIVAAAESLGDRFESAHDRALPCRFIAGPCDGAEAWRAGVLAPSIDTSGRRFLAVLGLDGLTPPQAQVLGLAISDRCERVLRRALVEALTADEALQALVETVPCVGEAAAAETLGGAPAPEGVWWRPGDADVHKGAAPPTGLVARALDAALQLGVGA